MQGFVVSVRCVLMHSWRNSCQLHLDALMTQITWAAPSRRGNGWLALFTMRAVRTHAAHALKVARHRRLYHTLGCRPTPPLVATMRTFLGLSFTVRACAVYTQTRFTARCLGKVRLSYPGRLGTSNAGSRASCAGRRASNVRRMRAARPPLSLRALRLSDAPSCSLSTARRAKFRRRAFASTSGGRWLRLVSCLLRRRCASLAPRALVPRPRTSRQSGGGPRACGGLSPRWLAMSWRWWCAQLLRRAWLRPRCAARLLRTQGRWDR